MRQDVPRDPAGTAEPGRRGGAAAAAARDGGDLLAEAVERTLRGTGAYGAMVYLRSRDGRSLVLSTVAGVPVAALEPFRRVSVQGALPGPLAYRSRRTVHLSGAEETMRRFPQLLMGLPYAFASAYAPVLDGEEVYGVLCALWPATGAGVPTSARRYLRQTARRLGAELTRLVAEGGTVEGRTTVAELPWWAGQAVRLGLFDLDLHTRALDLDDELCSLFGLAPGADDGRAMALAAAIDQHDLPRLRVALRRAHRTGQFPPLRLRITDGSKQKRPVQVWARVREGVTDGVRGPHLVGVVLDVGTTAAAAQAVERLRQGVFSLDGEGRVEYANLGAELLLGVRREELLGRPLWEGLPWLADPVHEDRYRAAVISRQPTAFLACRPPDQWLAFTLQPDPQGMTGTVVPGAHPGREKDTRVSAGPAVPVVQTADGATPGAGAIYHLLQLAGALAQAVTVREVCAAVAEQILPAFGGQELAIYAVEDNRLHLALQVGYPEGFLDPFEGTPMRARLPGAETLASGAPIFFASVDELAGAYPGIPLDQMCAWAFLPLIASGRPVGSCILGFDEPHPFTSEERAVLTALGGLIAQALERARLYDAEFALARGLQQALLPRALPRLDNVRIAARYLPGTRGMEIGGDWYDAIVTERGLCLVIGDVEGHSVAAAGVMGQLRSAVRAFVASGHPPDRVLENVNRLLPDLGAGLLASCCLVELDPVSGRARGVRAGHLPPLLRRPDGRTEVLDLGGGVLLGVDPSASYPVDEVRLAPGSVLALYTDGLVERPGGQIDHGIDQVRAVLAHADAASLEQLADRLLAETLPTASRADDVAVLLAAIGG